MRSERRLLQNYNIEQTLILPILLYRNAKRLVESSRTLTDTFLSGRQHAISPKSGRKI
jgi:hypothetical protein